jgi:hypothetical protein
MMTGLQSCAGPEVWQMKKIGFRVLAPAVLLLGLLLAAPVLAGQKHDGPKHSAHGHSWNGQGHGHTKGPRGSKGVIPPGHVPELDPGLLGSAAVLLIGGMLVLHGRRPIEPNA